MIFNTVRGGGGKEYTITARNNINVSATKQKPGHIFQATASNFRTTTMEFTDPDTGELVKIGGKLGETKYVMPCADVTLS